MTDSLEINATAASILGFLTLGPMTGWDLNQLAQASVSYFWSVTRSQVYRELTALAALGLVTAEEAGSRNTRRFHLTDAGRERLLEWLREPPGPTAVRDPFLVKLFFADLLSPAELEALLDAGRRRLEEASRQYAAALAVARQVSPFMAATARWGIASNRAALHWFDRQPWTER